MSRTVRVVDRIVTVAVAAALLWAAAFLALGPGGLTVPGWSGPRSPVDAAAAAPAVDLLAGEGPSWVTWVLVAAGVLVVLVGLRWAAAHLPRRGPREVTLPGSGPQGRFAVATDPVVEAVAGSMAAQGDVEGAAGRIVTERRRPVAVLKVRYRPGADLAAIAAAGDRCARELSAGLGRHDLGVRVELRPAKARSRVS